MKKLFFLLALLTAGISTQAQGFFRKERLANLQDFDNQFLSWGYYLGFNHYDFKFRYFNQLEDHNTDIIVKPSSGFNVGLVGDMRINKYINLRLEPGLLFTSRDLTFPNLTQEKDYFREVKSTYIHIPLLVKLSTKRINNIRPFVMGGASASFNLTSSEKHPEDNQVGRFRMTTNTLYYELGFGIDFYLYYFKFTPSIRGVFAISDELTPDDDPNSPWTGNIEYMGSRAILINLTFQ